MTFLVIVLFGLAIGVVLGSLGGGGAILTVPALVYVVGQPAQQATTSSLVIVGITALVGMASYISSHRVRWDIGIGFGLAGIPAAYTGTYLNQRANEHYLLIGFSVLMVMAAVAMVSGKKKDDHRHETEATAGPVHASATTGPPASGAAASGGVSTMVDKASTEVARSRRPSRVGIVAAGLVVGFLTGFFGVGGGFVIVPALVLVLGLPIKQAVGTSLLVIAANSATSLIARAGVAHFDWSVIIPFTLAAMVATLAGKQVADRLPASRLKIGFASLLVLVASYTTWQSIGGLTAPATASTSTTSSTSIADVAVVKAEIAEGRDSHRRSHPRLNESDLHDHRFEGELPCAVR